MSKPKKVRFTGVLPFVNGSPISRVQSFSIDPDLNFSEVYELGNPNIVQYDRDTPDVTVTMNTNDFASIGNLRKITDVKTGTISMSDLEGKSVAVSALIEQDGALSRTAVSVNCYVSSIAWSYDVGGVATENYSFTTDNKTMFSTTYKQTIVVPLIWLGSGSTTVASGYVASGTGVLGTGTTDQLSHYTFDAGSSALYNLSGYKVLYVWNDSWRSDAVGTTFAEGDVALGAEDSYITWTGTNCATSGNRIFAIAYKVVTDANIDSYSTESGIASVRKGQVTIDIAPAGSGGTYEQWFRVQTCNVDVDLARDTLEELGNYYAYDQSLPDPIIATVNLTMMDTDLEAFYEAAGLSWDEDTATEIDLADFARQAAVRIRVYSDKDRLASQLKKEIVLDQIQVTAESFSVDVQDNARQTMTATTSYLTISGADLTAP